MESELGFVFFTTENTEEFTTEDTEGSEVNSLSTNTRSFLSAFSVLKNKQSYGFHGFNGLS